MSMPTAQVVSSELACLGEAHSALQASTAQLKAALGAAEQLVRVREVEVEDVRAAYEGLATEHRRAQATIMQVGSCCSVHLVIHPKQ
jgi:hypothetical protein